MKKKQKKILIIGSLPPPVGGVTIHVQRLKHNLDSSNICYTFFDLSSNSLINLISKILTHNIIHLHTSNSFLCFGIVLFSKVLSKTLILTYHGDLGRFNGFKRVLDRQAIKLAAFPIMINDGSYMEANRLNKNAKLFSAFIPPSSIQELELVIKNKILNLKKQYNSVFCTNAFNLVFDNKGDEVYQISNLVRLFDDVKNHMLIVSDPSGKNLNWIKKQNIKISSNIIFIPYSHDFNAIIRMSDCVIRFTLTDGDSLSVKEALYHGKNVIASNIVSRPKGTILTSLDLNELKMNIQRYVKKEENVIIQNGFLQLKELYKEIIN